LKNTLDFVREQDARDRDDKIRLMRPRQGDSSAAVAPAADLPEARTQNG